MKTLKKRMKKDVYTNHDYNSGDGMLTSVWGPSLWHYLHTMSFNFPNKPTKADKKYYKEFLISLKHVLPCKYCRINLINNFKELPITEKRLENREQFSRYVYELHELVNKMLHKKSNLSYEDVRERYEHFRSRCTLTDKEVISMVKRKASKNKTRKKEKGCTRPLYGKKSKCIIKIVPQETKCDSFQIHKKCIKRDI